MCFVVVSLCFLFFLCCRLVFLSFCIYNRNTHIKTEKQTEQLEGKHKNIKNRNLPARTWEILIRCRVEGWISCIYVCVWFSSSCLWLFVWFFRCVFMFSPSLFKLLHLQSKKKQKNQKEQLKGKHEENRKEKHKSPCQTLRYIYFSRRFVGCISCIVCFCLNVVLV